MAQTSSSPFTVQIVAAPPPPTKSFQLTSALGGTDLPFTIGYAFGKGDIPNGTTLTLDAGTAQVLVKRQWNDGSVKHVVVSGHVTLVAGVAKDIQVVAGPSSGTALTSANIVTAAPTASVTCGANTVQLAGLLATPFRTWISGPEMVECHYRAPVPTDATLVVWFHVRLYRLGRIWIRAFCENGYVTNSLDGTGSSAIDKSYVPGVSIGGLPVYDIGGASLAHYGHARWDVEGWIGGDPLITPRHNVAQLIATRLVPNYWKRSPSAAALNGLVQSYAPMAQGDWTLTMGDTGSQAQIGLLPLWDALYCTSGDARAFRSVIANARALNGYGIVWRDSTDGGGVTRPSQRPDWTLHGINGGGGGFHEPVTGTRVWDVAHHGSCGYLAYLLTGDFYHLETMQHQASVVYLSASQADGLGTSRVLRGQTRAMAWSLRTVGQLAAIGPTGDSVTNDYAALLAGNMTSWNSVRVIPGQNTLGTLYSNDLATNAYADPGVLAPWQQNFVVQTLGHLSEIEPLTDMSVLILVRDYYYRWPVGMLGDIGPANFCFTEASAYNVKVASIQTSDLTQCFASWGAVFQATFNVPNGSCGTTLQGTSGSDPLNASQGYYGNLMPAITYAVEHGATGAAAAWARFTGASNWIDVQNSGFDDWPIWGIVPRGTLGT